MAHEKIVVFGATGFVGKVLVQYLAKKGYGIVAPSRRPGLATSLKPLGEVGQITPVFCDVTKACALDTVIEGAYGVVNLVGVGFEKGSNTFENVHIKAAKALADTCGRQGVRRLVHVSALMNEADQDIAYMSSKRAGEEAVQHSFPSATILRPSLVFGLGSPFFTMLGDLAKYAPVLPIFGSGQTQFQPVYVGDLAQAIVHCLMSSQTLSGIYEIAGNQLYTLKELMEMVQKETHRRKIVVHLPLWAGQFFGYLQSLLPNPVFTHHQINMLKCHSYLSGNHLSLKDLDITPTDLMGVLPLMMKRFSPVF